MCHYVSSTFFSQFHPFTETCRAFWDELMCLNGGHREIHRTGPECMVHGVSLLISATWRPYGTVRNQYLRALPTKFFDS